ncbi:MAG TPA: hypothetical protein VF162_08735 [Streptosporangiaceae bacterium]
MNEGADPGSDAGRAGVEERLRHLEVQVAALNDAVEELARGLGDGSATEPLIRAAEAGRRAHELLLLARSAPHERP